MKRTNRILLPALLWVAACNDQPLEGEFGPSCIAFAGDRVTFANGRFEWDRFTDERRVDDDGNMLDPFPDYPRHGDFRVERNRVEFVPDDGERLAPRYLLERDGTLYLLERAQYEKVLAGGSLPDCALSNDQTDS